MTNKTETKSKIPPAPTGEPTNNPAESNARPGSDAANADPHRQTEDAQLTAGAGGDGSTGEQPPVTVSAVGSGTTEGVHADKKASGADNAKEAKRRAKYEDTPDHELPEDMQRERGFLWSQQNTPAGVKITHTAFSAGAGGTSTREIVIPHDKANGENAEAEFAAARKRIQPV